jgi:GNAT superfamily N-acetyltransferase
MTNQEPVHPESEAHPWEINVPNHATRTDSPEYVAARNKMNEIAGQAAGMIYGSGPYQDHHGGALWLQDSHGWFLVRNQAGIEWSAQFCLSGEARVLTADLRWIPIKDVFVGQILLGFDEESRPGLWRRWRPSEVLAKRMIERPCYDLVFDDGTRVRASAEHRWLVGHDGAHVNSEWVTTESLRATRVWTPEEEAKLLTLLTSGASVAETAERLGRSALAVASRKAQLMKGQAGISKDVRSKVLRLVDVWDEDHSRGAGYLAAAFDGEGWLTQVEDEERGRGFGTSVRLGFAQRSNAMLEEVEKLLKERGVAYSLRCGSDNCNRIMIRGRAEIMRLLGSVRPQRLLADFQPATLGTMQRVGVATLVEKKFVGMQPVVAITTSTGTFVAEGLASHNCADPAKVDLLRQNAKRLYDLVSPQVKQQLDPGGLLDTPIQDAAGVAKWTDSIFNAGVPLHPTFHTGVLPTGAAQNPPAPGTPQPAGVHHYPTPIADIQLFKYDDFQLWVTDQQGNPAAVAPVDNRGSGNASVHVLYATPGSQLAQQKHEAESAGAPLILGPDHPLSVQAYQNQQAPGSGGTPGPSGTPGSGGTPGT